MRAMRGQGLTIGAGAAALAAAWAAAPMAQAAPSAGPPHALGQSRHLFIDEFLVAEKEQVTLAVNPPQRKELVLVADRPWERHGITSYCNVLRDEAAGEYRLYYVPIHLDTDPPFGLALATSKDGVHWEKPSLGVVEWQGSRDNNIVLNGQREGTVMIDPNAPPERRYAYLSSEPALRTRLFTSPDGIHWKMHPTAISDLHSDSQISTFWDDGLRRYVHYPRVGHRGRAAGRVEATALDEPWPKEIPVVLSADDQDPPGTDLYTNSAQKYALSPNVYVAFPTPYYHYNEPDRAYLNEPALQLGGNTNDGVIDTQLAVSRDGRTWARYRTPYVPLYRHEDLDLKVAMVFPGLLYHATHVDQYQGGYTFTHGDRQARRRLEGRVLGGIFRLEQRIDGFVSADFAYTGGSLTTEPFTFQGASLRLNVNTSAAGEGRVGILTAEGAPIAGCTLAESDVVSGDLLDKCVTWAGRWDVSALAGRPVRLCFRMRGAKLYSFRFAGRPAELPPYPRAVRVEDPRNVAPQAEVAVSSAHPGGYDGRKAVDGVTIGRVAGEPCEWASRGEKAGAWIELRWAQPVTVDSVLLYDRPGGVNHVRAGTLTFSEGPPVRVGELPNDGETGAEARFPPRRVSWLRFTVDETSPDTQDIGLAEILVRRVPGG